MDIKTDLNTCDHCNRTFVRESTLLKHVCEQKLRWQDKDKPQNRIAFNAWLTFYSRCQPGKKKKDYKTFITSAYYTAFVKFGLYCVNVKVVNSTEYLNHLLSNNVSIDNWASDQQYTKYLIQYLRMEDPFDAVKRSIQTMLDISEKENLKLSDVLLYYSKNKLCSLISSGQISPWILYLSDSGLNFLDTINEDQRSVIWEYINPERWNLKFARDRQLFNEVSETIKQVLK